MGMRFRAGAMGVPFLPMRSMLGSDVVEQAPGGQGDRLPVHRREAAAGSGAQSRCRADPRAALRCLRQCADRRAAVHGHRSRDGGEPGDPDHRAHRLERPDPPRARPDQDPVLLRSTPSSRCRSARRRTNATASTSRCSSISTPMPRRSTATRSRACGNTSIAMSTARNRGPNTSTLIGIEEIARRRAAAGQEHLR